MKDLYPITPDFRLQRPLREGDQALVDAIEGVEPGLRGDEGSNFIKRALARRPAGTFGEVIVGAVLNDEGQQDFVFVDVMPIGVITGIDTREPGTRGTAAKQVAFFRSAQPQITNMSEAQAIKLEAARRIHSANKAA